MAKTSIVPIARRAHFGGLAGDWWDPDGASAMLHKLNPVRLGYVRDMVDQHFGLDEHGLRPLAGKTALDVGCGAGLLAEPLARLGAAVTAVDAAPELIEVAKAHAAGQGLAIDYRAVGVEAVEGQFDLVTAMEVIEHVADPQAFVDDLAARLAPGRAVDPLDAQQDRLVEAADHHAGRGLRADPEGHARLRQVHRPRDDARAARPCRAGGASMSKASPSRPTRGLHLSENLSLNYLVAAKSAG